jgi:hypothetical protein
MAELRRERKQPVDPRLAPLYTPPRLRGGPDSGLRCRLRCESLTGGPVEPDPVSTGVGSRSCAIRRSESRLLISLPNGSS